MAFTENCKRRLYITHIISLKPLNYTYKIQTVAIVARIMIEYILYISLK